MAAQHLVIAGSRGVGKSTSAANLAAALAEAGEKVVLVCYDPAGKSTSALRGEGELKALQQWRGEHGPPLYGYGYLGTLCIEAGRIPLEPGHDETASLLESGVVAGYRPDFVVHDLPFDPGREFVIPAAAEGLLRVLVVTSAGLAAIESTNRLFSWLNTLPAANCRFGGVVVNNLSAAFYQTIVDDFVSRSNTSIAASIPHSLMVSVSDFYNRTVLELAPLSQVAYTYRKLARSVVAAQEFRRPKCLPAETLRNWAIYWGDVVTELETGVVRDGASI